MFRLLDANIRAFKYIKISFVRGESGSDFKKLKIILSDYSGKEKKIKKCNFYHHSLCLNFQKESYFLLLWVKIIKRILFWKKVPTGEMEWEAAIYSP